MRWRLVGWTGRQWVLRALVAVLPVAAVLAAWPDRPATWLLVLVGALAAGWAAFPESTAGVVVLVVVAGWWGIAVADPLDAGLVLAAAGLVGAHVSATLASYGPGRMAVSPQLVRRWLGRAAAMVLAAPAVLLVVLQLDAAAVPAGVWVSALVAVAAATTVAGLALGHPGQEG